MLADFSHNDLQRLANIVREVTGNNVQEKHFSMLQSRLRAHMLKLGIADIGSYWRHFAAHEATERRVLQGLMTTHYTFFFREYVHFEALETWIEANHARLKQRYTTSKLPLRVWSAACSRGQEAYSVAMFLKEHLLGRYGIDFRVLGTDIDEESVRYAQNGVYPIKEVNTIPQRYLDGNWKRGHGEVEEFAVASRDLRDRTTFNTMNLLDLDVIGTFDIIFARNVFIYFSEDNVKKIALNLANQLEDGGLFISGVSEPLRFAEWTLPSVASSCYQKPMSASEAIAPPQVNTASKYRVLCVDDSATIQALMKKIFAMDQDCLSVTPAMHGLEARQKLDIGAFDIITLDIHMPVMDGISFLEKAYKQSQDPPVIMVTSVNRADIDHATKSMALGAFDYVEKPAMNNLQKSADELLTKVKMALRTNKAKRQVHDASDFDRSIARKIVVPDASQCLRWLKVDSESTAYLEPILKTQMHEYRSPPMLLVTKANNTSNLEKQILAWTQRKVERLHDAKTLLRPNFIYICDEIDEQSIYERAISKNISLQILSLNVGEFSWFAHHPNLQVLLAESLSGEGEDMLRRCALTLSDVTPPTSFISLSLEYFAHLRKVNAA